MYVLYVFIKVCNFIGFILTSFWVVIFLSGTGTFGDANFRGPIIENYHAPSFTDQTYEY